MDYKLAQELKDAGFPQPEHTPLSIPRLQIKEVEGSFVHFPILEELIAECGEGFFRLTHSQCIWEATCPHKTIRELLSETGKTPLIAVANLYIALNK